MQASPHSTERRVSLVSDNSISSEACVNSPPSTISSGEILSKSIPNPPPKPSSNVAAAIRLFKDRYECILTESWNSIQLHPDEYDELWRYLEREEGKLLRYIENKVHFDYDPNTYQLSVRMPAAVHEYLASTVEAAIGWQLEVIRGGIDEIAMHVRKIRNCRSASIFLEDNTRRDPDSQFTYDGARWPPFVIEIANSQSKKDGGKNLPKLADQYITESSGNIQTVLGICLDYRGTKKATLSIWRSNYGVDQQGEYLAADEILVSQEFRKADGSPVTDQTLRLPLRYFLPRSVLLPPTAIEQEIVISYEILAQCLETAERRDQDRKTGTVDAMPEGVRKRKREETPPETLSATDERRFEQEEDGAERLADEEDEDWKET